MSNVSFFGGILYLKLEFQTKHDCSILLSMAYVLIKTLILCVQDTSFILLTTNISLLNIYLLIGYLAICLFVWLLYKVSFVFIKSNKNDAFRWRLSITLLIYKYIVWFVDLCLVNIFKKLRQ